MKYCWDFKHVCNTFNLITDEEKNKCLSYLEKFGAVKYKSNKILIYKERLSSGIVDNGYICTIESELEAMKQYYNRYKTEEEKIQQLEALNKDIDNDKIK